MPAIKTKRSLDGTQLTQVLQEVLHTKSHEWSYFFYPHRIQQIFADLAHQIRTKNFFTSDYSITIFLDFLKAYIKETCNTKQLKTIDEKSLYTLNRVIEALHERIINHTIGLTTSQKIIINNYLSFLHLLMETRYRDLFDKPQIKLNSNAIQAISTMLKNNSASLNNDLILQYISLLKLSFDVPKLLANYDIGLDITPLAAACFLEKNIDNHIMVTQIFTLLGYQGQLLDYYKFTFAFTINVQLQVNASYQLQSKAIALQHYFFNNLPSDDIDKPLLQHYLYIYFFKELYKKYPNKLAALKKDLYLSDYIKFDYVALPNSLDCRNYLPIDNTVIIEYKNLIEDPTIACQAIACSTKSYEQWQTSLGFQKQKSRYIFRVAKNYKHYFFTYAYGHSPIGAGFYIRGETENNIVNGEGYSFFSDMHTFIEVSRHEAVHHDNFKLYIAARNNNSQIASFTNRNFNEGLAVLFAGGACAPGYVSKDFSNITAPSLNILLENRYIGYLNSWLYTNYFIQQYSNSNKNFFSDLLHLNQTVFIKKWTPILQQDSGTFFNWLPFLKRVCQDAPEKLSLEHCPSIYLTDYSLSRTTESVATTTVPFFKNTEVLLPSEPFITKKLTADEMGHSLIFKIAENKFDEFRKLLKEGANPNFCNELNGNTPLHYLYFYGQCNNLQYLELLFQYGAHSSLNKESLLPYAIAEKNCNATQLLAIKRIFDKQWQNFNSIKNNKATLLPYQRSTVLTSFITPFSAFASGIVTEGWQELSQRNRTRYSYLPNIIFYGLQPTTSAVISATMNSLVSGSAESLGLKDSWLSFFYYLGVNYFGMMLAQLGKKATKNVQNKFLKILIPSLLYIFLFNPSLLITLLSEGFATMNVIMPLLSMLTNSVFFKLGEFASQTFIKRSFPMDESISSADNRNKSIRFSIFAHPKKIPDDKKILEDFQNNFNKLIRKLQKKINKQAYVLNIEEEIVIITDGISELLSEIDKDKKYINTDTYKMLFKKIEKNLNKIIDTLEKLKIEKLRLEVADLLAMLRGIRPFSPPSNHLPDLLEKPDCVATSEEQVPLMNFSTVGKNNGVRLAKGLFPFRQTTDLPPPPTEQELQEIERVYEL